MPKILIAEDDPVTRKTVTAFLQREGYHVVACKDGPSAVGAVMSHRPDLILLDLGLPSPDPIKVEVFDGFRVLSWILKIRQASKVPVIILTAEDPAEVRDRVLEAGASAFLQKPPDWKELGETIRNLLGTQGAAEQSAAQVP